MNAVIINKDVGDVRTRVPWQAPTGPVASAHGMPRGPVASAHGITWQAPTGPVANAHGMPRYFYSPVAYPWAPWACPRILYECHPSSVDIILELLTSSRSELASNRFLPRQNVYVAAKHDVKSNFLSFASNRMPSKIE